MKFFITTALFYFMISVANAQTIKGVLVDETDKSRISGATINLFPLDSLRSYKSISDSAGRFVFINIVKGNYKISVSSIGYNVFEKEIMISDSLLDLGTLSIQKNSKVLNTVSVTGSAPPVKQKTDTVEYSANAYKVNPDANAEDLIRKMPGVTVENGTVTAHGEQVKKVTVDGRDFFGDDATAALRNLPSEVIDKIQVFDKLSDQAQFTGFDDGSSVKSINIVTKSGLKNGQFGRVYAGYGTDERYSAGGNVSFFKGNQRISLVANLNNINQQNFATQDLLGVTSSQNRGGGGNRGGGQSGGTRGGGQQGGNRGGGQQGGGDANNFLVGTQTGINKTNAFGINYSNVWNKKVTLTGSYFFNNSNTANQQLVNRQTFITQDSTQFYNEQSNAGRENTNNRVNLRLEYKIDSQNTLIITPNLSFQNNRSNETINGVNFITAGDTLSRTANDLNSVTKGYNIGNNILFRHAFAKRGRTVSISLNTTFNDKNGDNYLNAINQYFKSGISDTVRQYSSQITNGNQISANLVYTEPLTTKSQLQFNYNPSFSKNHADQETFNYDNSTSKFALLDTGLSNKFVNTFNTQNGGVTFRTGDKDNQFSAGLSYQYSSLKSEQEFPFVTQVNKSFNNLLGNLMWRVKLNAKSNFRLMYRGAVTPPRVTQLQNVINNSNQFFYTTGNPDLKQQYNNSLIGRYSYTNTLKGQSFFANLFLQTTKDYISNATFIANSDSALTKDIILYRGSQISKPVNLNGYLSARSFFTFGTPIKPIKSNLNLNAGFSYAKLPGLINNVANTSNNYTYTLGAVLSSNISQYVDFNLSYTGNINVIKNTIRESLNNNYYNQVINFQSNLLSKKGWFLQNDITNQNYTGLSSGFNQNYWLWNAAAGKKFLKNQAGELKLSVFDILKQNKSIVRNTTESYIEDVQNLVLQQYFMLTFTYNLKNFTQKKK